MKTVLVVDENDAVLDLVKKSLEGAGYQVSTRSKPSGSVAAILRDQPDVVLLDVNMPSLSGDTIAKILARVSQNLDTLVLLHSNLSIDNLRLKAIATGAHGYIQKTDSPTELVRRVEYWLHRSRYASSASRLETAPLSGPKSPNATATATSSGRFAAASNVAAATASAGGVPSSRKIEAAPPIASSGAPPSSSRKIEAAPPDSNPSAPSSREMRAAAAVAPNGSSSSGSMPTARGAPSAGSLKVAPKINDDSSASSGGKTTSRNMRAAKPSWGSLKPKVLFVDDDWKMLSSYRTMVAGQLDAEFVSSSDDAFNRLISEKPPSIVVCDVVMPGLSGADIYRRAVLLDRTWAKRFIFITGAASTPSVAEFLNTLDVRVFHKPVPTERLLDTLKQMTEGQRR